MMGRRAKAVNPGTAGSGASLQRGTLIAFPVTVPKGRYFAR